LSGFQQVFRTITDDFSMTSSPPGNKEILPDKFEADAAWKRIFNVLLPLLLAAFGLFWSLRWAGKSEVVFFDASRHATNGALILDLVRSHAFAAPVKFAQQFYARLPAISLPYHPPLFPAFEALMFGMFGVSTLTARVSIAILVAACCVLLYRLVVATHGSRALAACVVLTFLALPSPQWVGSDVMLEFPSLLPVLAALLCLRGLDFSRLAPALGYAILAIAAVWTKQQTVFLLAVPFLYAAIGGRWYVFRRTAFWISMGSILAGAGAMYAVSKLANAASSTAWAHQDLGGFQSIYRSIWSHLVFYSSNLHVEIGWPGAVLFAAALGCYAIFRARDPLFADCDLYVAAIAGLLGLLVFMPFWETRYLFHVLPAMVVLGFTLLYKIGSLLFDRRFAWAVPALVSGLAFVYFGQQASWLSGPMEAARTVAGSGTRRVLYCGIEVGTYIFDTRALDSHPEVTIIRGDKLPEGLLGSERLVKFLHYYGIDRVVLERHEKTHNDGMARGCTALSENPPGALVLEREIPMPGNQPWLAGEIRVYRVPGQASPGSNQPGRELTLPSTVLEGGVQIDLAPAE
jgi:hypothetical protein